MVKNPVNKGVQHDNKAVETVQSLIFTLLCLTVFMIPLFFSIYSYDQFELPKLTLLRIMTFVMLGLWLVKVVLKGRIEYSPTPLDLPLGLWVVVNLITTFTSFAPHLSFRGEYENFAGSLSNINYVVLYYIAVNNIAGPKQVERLNLVILGSGLLLTLYAVMQFFGHDFIKWSAGSMIKGRYFASMGNPNFLGAVLIMIIPIALSFLAASVRKKNTLFTAGLVILLALLYLSLFGTQSRGPVLGFAVSMAFFAVYGLFKLRAFIKDKSAAENIKKSEVLLAIAKQNRPLIAISAVVLIAATIISFTAGKSAMDRLWTSVTNPGDAMKVSRLHIWKPAVNIIKDHPLFGTGVDTFKTIFPKYSGTDFAQIDGANVSSRTAHNEPLNVAATMGLPALIIYFFLLFRYYQVFRRGYSRLQDSGIRLLSFAMFVSFIAYFTQNLFSFGVAAINTILYVNFAMHARLGSAGVQKKVINLGFTHNSAAKGFAALLAAVIAVTGTLWAYNFFSADMNYNRGRIWGNHNNRWDLAVKEHFKSVEKQPFEVKYHVYLGLAYERLAMTINNNDDIRNKAVAEAVHYYKKSIELNPGNAYYWGNLGRVNMMVYRTSGNSAALNEAVKYYEESVRRAPVTGLFYNNLAEVYITAGLTEKAEEIFEKLALYDKNYAAGTAFMLGNIYFSQKTGESLLKAKHFYTRASELRPELAQAYHNLGVVSAALGHNTDAGVNLEKFLEMDPNSDMAPNAREILKKIKK